MSEARSVRAWLHNVVGAFRDLRLTNTDWSLYGCCGARYVYETIYYR